ncbi:MAG: response regulator [Cyanobacteria bacterium J06633_2]
MANDKSSNLDNQFISGEPCSPVVRQCILIVDDQPDNLRLLSNMLVNEGYDVRRALSGRLALQNVQVNPPDLILLDINMPELSGYDVCQSLKADAKTRSIPIIFLSASNSEQDKVQAFELGGVDYITKPFQVREVLARVATQFKLQQLNRLRENLSRMLVHDLRTPLSSIVLCSSSLMNRTYITSDDQDILKDIYTTGKRLNHMLNDLLVIAKLDDGKLVLNRAPTNLPSLIDEVIHELTVEAESKQVKLVSLLSDSAHSPLLDTNLFRRVIENLVTNAIKFSPRGGTVTVSLVVEVQQHTKHDSNATMVLQVIDAGLGVPEEQRQAIFKPYETGQHIGGVSQIGLGLSFCKLVVDAHGGCISVNNNQPTGAIFKVVMSC